MNPSNSIGALPEVLSVDLHLLGELGDVGHVDLDGSIPQGLHELVVLELAVLGLVGVPDDADGAGIARVTDRAEDREIMLTAAELENLRLRGVVHAVEVEAEEVRLHLA